MWMKEDYLVVIMLNLRILSYLCVGCWSNEKDFFS